MFFHSQLLGISPIGRTLFGCPRSQSDMRISKVRCCCFHTDLLELACRIRFTKPCQKPTHAMNFKIKFMQHDRRQPNTCCYYYPVKVTKVHKYEESAMANICIVETSRTVTKYPPTYLVKVHGIHWNMICFTVSPFTSSTCVLRVFFAGETATFVDDFSHFPKSTMDPHVALIGIVEFLGLWSALKDSLT